MPPDRYTLRLTPPARRQLDRLPSGVAAAVLELITGSLLSNPRRVGKSLSGVLVPHFVARRGSYRVLYLIRDEENVVEVRRIEHRRDAYRAT